VYLPALPACLVLNLKSEATCTCDWLVLYQAAWYHNPEGIHNYGNVEASSNYCVLTFRNANGLGLPGKWLQFLLALKLLFFSCRSAKVSALWLQSCHLPDLNCQGCETYDALPYSFWGYVLVALYIHSPMASVASCFRKSEASWNVLAHAQKPDFVFRRNGRVHLNRRGASVQSTAGSRGVRISRSNAGYTMFRGSVKSTGYPLHSPVSPSLPLPCVTVCHHISTGVLRGLKVGIKCLETVAMFPFPILGNISDKSKFHLRINWRAY
jgi:hypothetical protein